MPNQNTSLIKIDRANQQSLEQEFQIADFNTDYSDGDSPTVMTLFVTLQSHPVKVCVRQSDDIDSLTQRFVQYFSR